MFNAKAKFYNTIFNIIKNVVIWPFSITLVILLLLNGFGLINNIIPYYFYMGHNDNNWIRIFVNILFFGLIGSCFGIVLSILNIIFKRIFLKIYSKECSEIIHSTVLPDKLPKVLYIYTTHNDLIQARVLQNSKQTYKNFEVWVSDGSTDKEWREQNKKFCKENNINIFQLGPEGSKNKADNLNQFLKQYKGDYDYLLIGDADEVFNSKFVEYGIKMFLSNKIQNLSYVSPYNVNYRIKGIYPNVFRILNDFGWFWISLPRGFKKSDIPELWGQSVLIKRSDLISCNGSEKFDEGNLEDWYLEGVMIEKMNYGVTLPNILNYYEPDVNVEAHFKRMMRIEDWQVRWFKVRNKDIIKNYNERFSKWYTKNIVVLFRPIFIFFGLGLLGLFSWIISTYWNLAFKNNTLFWITLAVSIFGSSINLLVRLLLAKKINFKIIDYLILPFIFLFWVFAINLHVNIHWFKSMILGKYSQFGGSGKSRFLKLKNKTLKWWITLLIFTLIIVLFNSLIFNFSNWWNIKWLIIFFNVYFGTIWLGCLSYLILWYINYIPYNSSFNREDWIECKEFI